MASKRFNHRFGVGLVLGLWGLLVSACASQALHVKHQDPRVSSIDILVDGDWQASVTYGSKVKIPMTRGMHEIQAQPSGKKQNIWSDDGRPWTVFFDREGELVLMAPEKGEGESMVEDQPSS